MMKPESNTARWASHVAQTLDATEELSADDAALAAIMAAATLGYMAGATFADLHKALDGAFTALEDLAQEQGN